MDEMIIPLFGLAAIFFIVALLYSSVGLGGASSYVPLLALAGVYYEWIPSTALMLNIAVTLIGSINYWKQGHLRMKLIGVFLLSSMPMSYLGGAIALDKEVFYLLLWVTLVFVAIRIYWKENCAWNSNSIQNPNSSFRFCWERFSVLSAEPWASVAGFTWCR